jgi:hypothetical protein
VLLGGGELGEPGTFRGEILAAGVKDARDGAEAGPAGESSLLQCGSRAALGADRPQGGQRGQVRGDPGSGGGRG